MEYWGAFNDRGDQESKYRQDRNHQRDYDRDYDRDEVRPLRESEYWQDGRQRDNERDRDERPAQERSLRPHDVMV